MNIPCIWLVIFFAAELVLMPITEKPANGLPNLTLIFNVSNINFRGDVVMNAEVQLVKELQDNE